MSLSQKNQLVVNVTNNNKHKRKPLYTLIIGKANNPIINQWDIVEGRMKGSQTPGYELLDSMNGRSFGTKDNVAEIRKYIASKCGCSMTNIFNIYCNGIFDDFNVKQD